MIEIYFYNGRKLIHVLSDNNKILVNINEANYFDKRNS